MISATEKNKYACSILNITVRGILTVKGRFNQRPEGSEGKSPAAVLGKSIPVRRNDKCKGPEAETFHELKGQKGDCMAETELVHGRGIGNDIYQRVGVDRRGKLCRVAGEAWFCIMSEMGSRWN